ncbi:MAG: DNA-binding protein [Thermodesulfobacteriota bacterium]
MNQDYPLSTAELAALAKVKPASIRVRLCQTGSYFGLRPQKLPNGRLVWPSDSLERLAAYRPEREEAK